MKAWWPTEEMKMGDPITRLKTSVSAQLDEETADRLDYMAARLTAKAFEVGVVAPVELDQALVRALKRGLDILEAEIVVRDPQVCR
jgi:hypothetical protein